MSKRNATSAMLLVAFCGAFGFALNWARLAKAADVNCQSQCYDYDAVVDEVSSPTTYHTYSYVEQGIFRKTTHKHWGTGIPGDYADSGIDVTQEMYTGGNGDCIGHWLAEQDTSPDFGLFIGDTDTDRGDCVHH